MTFDTDEKSVQDSRPVEGYKIEIPTATYFLTSAARSVVIAGDTYVPTTIARDAVRISTNSAISELIVSLLVSHPVAQRYLQNGIPMRDCKVTVYRQQIRSGLYSQWCQGYATAIGAEGHIATLRIPARTSDAMRVKLPTIGVSRTCPHILYDTQCQADRNGTFGFGTAKKTTTIASISGDTITVASLAGWIDHIARFGELVHTPSGERRSIYEQVGAVLTLQMPIPGAANGDAVDVYAGCDHSVDGLFGCLNFANVVNFGGIPELPSTNPFAPSGFGIVTT